MSSPKRFWLVTSVALILCFEGAAAQQMSASPDEVKRQANAALDAGLSEEGVGLLKRLAASTTGPQLDSAETALGRAYRIVGKLRDARAKLKGPIERTGHVPAILELARTHYYTWPHEPKRALELLDGALEREPRSVEVLLEMGRARMADEDYDKALAMYRLVTHRFAPKDVRAWLGTADAFILKGRGDKAKDVLTLAQQVAPQDPEPLARMGNMALLDQGSVASGTRAIGWYARALELGRNQPRYYAALFMAYCHAGQLGAAAPVLSRLEALAPEAAATVWARGVQAEQEGRIPEALAHYRNAVARDSTNVFAHYSLGMLLAGRANGDFLSLRGGERGWRYAPHRDADGAVRHLKTVVILDPVFAFAEHARELVQQLESTPTEPDLVLPVQRQMQEKLQSYYRSRARLF